MSERDTGRNRETERDRTSPRHLATVGLYALSNYKEAGMVRKGDYMHEQIVARLARIATENHWEE